MSSRSKKNLVPSKMKNVTIVKCKPKHLVCEEKCNVVPCRHFTLEDYSIFLPQTKRMKEIVRTKFNFATFVSRLCRTDIRSRLKLLDRVLNYKQTLRKNVVFRVDLNQRDPRNGKTALHYACNANALSIVAKLRKSPDSDVNVLDDDGLPPMAYYFEFLEGSSDQSRLRTFVAHRSGKLFRFLFRNVSPPSGWNSDVFETLTFQTMRLMNVSQRGRVVREIRDSKGNTLLHQAAKRNRPDVIRFILTEVDRDAQWIQNSKGKLPVYYCKTLECFDLFFHIGFHREVYFNTASHPLMKKSTLLCKLYPEIVERYRRETRLREGRKDDSGASSNSTSSSAFSNIASSGAFSSSTSSSSTSSPSTSSPSVSSSTSSPSISSPSISSSSTSSPSISSSSVSSSTSSTSASSSSASSTSASSTSASSTSASSSVSTRNVVTSSHLELLLKFKPYLNPDFFEKVSKFVRDPASNSLWHLTNDDFDHLSLSSINERNIFGNTVLHLNPNKTKLLELGAHPDLLNRAGLVATSNPGTELTVCSLKCLAARKGVTGNVPYFLKDFVDAHHSKSEEAFLLKI